jgi:hypothetical protein
MSVVGRSLLLASSGEKGISMLVIAMFLGKVDTHVPDYTVTHLKRPQSRVKESTKFANVLFAIFRPSLLFMFAY